MEMSPKASSYVATRMFASSKIEVNGSVDAQFSNQSYSLTSHFCHYMDRQTTKMEEEISKPEYRSNFDAILIEPRGNYLSVRVNQYWENGKLHYVA